jgi:hypothetical protein
MYKFTIQIGLLYKVYSQFLYSKTRKRFILLYKVSTIQSLRFSYTCTRVEYTTRSRKHCTGISKSKLMLVYLSKLIVQIKVNQHIHNFKNYQLNLIKINMLNMYVRRTRIWRFCTYHHAASAAAGACICMHIRMRIKLSRRFNFISIRRDINIQY